MLSLRARSLLRSGTLTLHTGHAGIPGKAFEQITTAYCLPLCGRNSLGVLSSISGLERKPLTCPPGFRAAAIGDSSGASEDDGPSGSGALLEALKGAELTFSRKAQDRALQPQPDITKDEFDDVVGTDPGTSSLLEALRKIENTRPNNGRNDRDAGSQSGLRQSLDQKPQPPLFNSEGPSSSSQSRTLIRVGSLVDIVLKKDQVNGRLTRGYVAKVLTNSQDHPRGIKVRLKSGEVGRVHDIIAAPSSTARAPAVMGEGVAQGGVGEDRTEEGVSGRMDQESRVPREQQPKKGKVEQGTKIFVSGFPREATNEDLTEALRAVDGVVDSFLVMNKQKRCQGYGFVQLVGDVEAALSEMNQLEVRGQKLTAAVSVERKPEMGGEASGSKGVSRPSRTKEGERGPQRTRQAESDGASLLLEAFRGVQEKRKARPATNRRNRRVGGGSQSWNEDDDTDEVSGEDMTPASEEIDGQGVAESGEGSGEPRVITIKDETSKQADSGPSMGQLVMAALERARKEKGIEAGPAASAAEKGGALASGETSSDDEQDQVPLKPLKIDPHWTKTIETLSRRLEEVKSLPVEI